jgi:hypothetical protein
MITMLARALDAGVPFAWVTADEVYGQAGYLRDWLEEHDAGYVLAIHSIDLVTTTDEGRVVAAEAIAALPARAWRRLSVGAGAHGPREYDWARIPIRADWRPGRGHWLLARRSISHPTEIAYYVCYGPRWSTLVDLPGSLGVVGMWRSVSSRRRTRPGWITTRSGPGGPGMPISRCLCWRLAAGGQSCCHKKGNRCPRCGHDRLHVIGDPPSVDQPGTPVSA